MARPRALGAIARGVLPCAQGGRRRVSDSDQYSAEEGLLARDRELGHMAFNFILDVAGRGIPGLKPLDNLFRYANSDSSLHVKPHLNAAWGAFRCRLGDRP